MLSVTNTIKDAKANLKTYDEYNFANDQDFKRAIRRLEIPVQLETMYPTIGEGLYNSISAKDKVGLTLTEKYLYYAEVSFLCAAFLSEMDRKEAQDRSGDSGSYSVEGYSQTITGKSSGYADASWDFHNEGRSYIMRAGYTLNTLKRGGDFFVEDNIDNRSFET